MKVKEYFRELAADYSPKNDPWGSAMGAYFDVAGVCYERGILVPTYSPGAAGPEVDDYAREYLDSLSDEELSKLARFLRTLTHIIDKAGRSY